MDLRYETLIFDLDGTISDPFVGISRSINYALETLSYDPVDPETVRPLIGPPLTEIFPPLTEIFGHLLGTLPEPEMLDLVDRYRERYASVGYAENEIYQDIPQTIARLAESGYRMGVCTSKREDYARRSKCSVCRNIFLLSMVAASGSRSASRSRRWSRTECLPILQ
jgi:phosphoglycolate phosphatase